MTDEEIVAALAEALRQHRPRGRHFCGCGWEGDDMAVHLQDVTAPVVLHIAEQRAAEKPDVMPFPAYGCDWGHCDNDSPFLRWADDLGAYLPVCERHAQDRLSVVPAALTATPNHGRNAT